jgi:hypothetical protein
MLPKTSCRIKEFCCLAGFTIQAKVVDIDKKKALKLPIDGLYWTTGGNAEEKQP